MFSWYKDLRTNPHLLFPSCPVRGHQYSEFHTHDDCNPRCPVCGENLVRCHTCDEEHAFCPYFDVNSACKNIVFEAGETRLGELVYHIVANERNVAIDVLQPRTQEC